MEKNPSKLIFGLHWVQHFENLPMTTEQKAVQLALKKLAIESNRTNELELRQPNKPPNVDWNVWLEKLSECKSSKSLWYWATEKEMEPQLITLINECNLIFIHPYIPLTEKNHTTFLDFAKKQTLLLTPTPSISNSSFSQFSTNAQILKNEPTITRVPSPTV